MMYFILLFPILNIKGFIFSDNKENHFKNKIHLYHNGNNINKLNNLCNLSNEKKDFITKFSSKSKSFLKLIRHENILPTLLLSFSGGFIANKSIMKIIKNPYFVITTINTLLILSSSMILNDIFDIEIDKKNKKNRPIVNGEITKNEAILSSIILLGFTEYLSYKYLPYYLQIIMNISMINIILYTPILKRILFIKNISCSYLVSFAIIVGGLASNTVNRFNNFNLLMIVSNMVFFGSLHNEILLDISDYSGDRDNKIFTIPVVFGKENAYKLVCFITNFFILFNSILVSITFNYKLSLPFYFIFYRLLMNLKKIQYHNYSNNIIQTVVKDTNLPLFLSVIYFCILSFMKQ